MTTEDVAAATVPVTGETTLRRRELLPLWQVLHGRLSSGRPVTRVRLGPLDEPQREALADLLGLDRMPDARPFVALARLEEAVTELSGRTVREVVAALVGPLGDRAGERRRQEDDRAGLWAWLAGHETVRAQPALADWAASCRASGLAGGSAARTRALLTDALTVLAALPGQAEPLPVFAARVLDGHAHALDDGAPLSTLVLRALATLYDTASPQSAAERRALWSRAGVADDELSSTVLLGGLRPLGDGLLARVARLCAEAGQAASLTLAHVRRPGALTLPATAASLVVHVVENPSILALALRRFGSDCPPLVCVSGWPNNAAIQLLRLLADQGAALRYHGDFDGEGIRIAAYVLAKTGAHPWRMTAADYRSAAVRNAHGPQPGRISEAPWDPQLAEAMAECDIAVVEELVADVLLEDLAAATARQERPLAVRNPPGG
ncbi:TIGR02679 family protein [Streptomyces koyangensis]|uniref:TIGR02679 family protein n=1 Tax=Streptomyces koyangensis TaxID=188770 RepID=A0A385D6I7_9ACTN|nr:TIGR02679 family protein [Streptomyces koyangensis]AXQ53521.1 TIGR02679 family protein [Streptomyces koyangensis]MBZ2406935.1 TIGR02679 family protein [Streptomyces sp. L06]